MSATATAAPTTHDDLLGLRLAHRTMLRDAHRIADLAERWAAGTESVDRRRARVLRSWTERLCTEIHHHHSAEDDVLWPILERCAGGAVDLAELSDDHAALDPVLAGVRRAVADATAGGDRALFAARARELSDMLCEHIAEEEADLFPIITAYVPLTDWQAVEKAVRERNRDIGFVLPRVVEMATDEEWARMRAGAPIMLVLMVHALRPGSRRRERVLFGA